MLVLGECGVDTFMDWAGVNVWVAGWVNGLVRVNKNVAAGKFD